MNPLIPLAQSDPTTPAIARWVLTCSILASSMAFIDGTALSVTLPALQSGLSATGTDLLWITNGFSVPLTALLLLGGSLGDAYGRQRILAIGIVMFAVASVACGIAPGVQALILARIIQGVGAALMIPGSLAMLSACCTPSTRGKAIGAWAAFSVIASAVGPVLGGLLARAGHWRWVFFINVPIAATALLIMLIKISPRNEPAGTIGIDWLGALLATLGLAGINQGLIQGSKFGFGKNTAIVPLLLGLVLLGLFIRVQRRTKYPLLPLEIFRSRTLTVVCGISMVFYTAFHGMLFFLPLNLIQVQGYDPAVAGLSQLPLMVLLIAFSRWAGRLVDQHGPRLPLTLGLSSAGLGYLLTAIPGITAGPREFWFTYLPGLLLVGMGLGLCTAPLSTTVMISVASNRLGLASGVNSSLSRLAGVLAIAVLGPLMVAVFTQSLERRVLPLNVSQDVKGKLKQESARLAEVRVPQGLSLETNKVLKQAIQSAFVDAFRLIAWIAAGLSWTGALLAVCFLDKREPIYASSSNHQNRPY